MKLRTKRNLMGCTLALVALASISSTISASADNASQGGKRGRISGYKFNDLNGNGQDDNEPRLPGVTILLNGLDNPGVSESTVTDEQGRFSFGGLTFQNYSVCEVAVPPLVPTTPECVEVRISRKKPKAEVVFGNRVTPGPSPTPSVTPSPTPSPSVTPSPTASPTASPSPTPSPTGCVRTQGFWGSSPAGQALVPIMVPGTLNLGNTGYSAAQLDDILDEPAGGNALLILAHQLIAAQLNIRAGADPAPVAQTIADANTAIANLVIPPVGTADVDPSSTLGQTMVSLAATLDAYNNGQLGVPHCP